MKIIWGWFLTVIALFFYSFSQIDLGLTLTTVSWWQKIQKGFQWLGWFQRPLSTKLYLLILFFLFLFYFLILKAVYQKKLKERIIWRAILVTALILWLAFNAFSYDLFNYIFYGKIITYYHGNPYQQKALDFPGDPMLGFMHWTHNTYPYGPVWLLLTVPLSFLGWQKLLPTMILFKALAVVSYLGVCWFIYRILAKTNPQKKLLGLTIFAFNPLVMIESLVSAHNDIVMLAFALAAFWFLLKKNFFISWLMLFLSIGIKFATVLFLPVFLFVTWQQHQKQKIIWRKVWLASFFLMVLALLLATKRSNLQPWYLLYSLPFLGLLAETKALFWPTVSFSAGLLLHYAPFLYLGHWNPPVLEIKRALNAISLFLGAFLAYFCHKGKQGLKK